MNSAVVAYTQQYSVKKAEACMYSAVVHVAALYALFMAYDCLIVDSVLTTRTRLNDKRRPHSGD